LALVLYPVIFCIVGLGVHSFASPDAYIFTAGFATPYLFAAFLLLKKIEIVRWLGCVWLLASSVYEMIVKIKAQSATGGPFAWMVFFAIVLLTICTLLFLPDSTRFFRDKKKPNQPLDPTPLRGAGHL